MLVRLEATTSSERHSVIALVEAALASAGGWIVDYHQYSNVSACITFEVPVDRLAVFTNTLATSHIGLTDRSKEHVKAVSQLETGEEVVAGTLQITFFHHEKDLRTPLPVIPR